MFEKENVLKALSETLDKMEKEKNGKEIAKDESTYWDSAWILLIFMAIWGFSSTPDHTKETYLQGKVDAYENVIGRMF